MKVAAVWNICLNGDAFIVKELVCLNMIYLIDHEECIAMIHGCDMDEVLL